MRYYGFVDMNSTEKELTMKNKSEKPAAVIHPEWNEYQVQLHPSVAEMVIQVTKDNQPVLTRSIEVKAELSRAILD